MIDLEIVEAISREAKYRKLKQTDCNFVSYVRYYSKGRIRINIYYNIDILILCITGRIKHPKFRKFINIKYPEMDQIFKYPNRFRNVNKVRNIRRAKSTGKAQKFQKR